MIVQVIEKFLDKYVKDKDITLKGLKELKKVSLIMLATDLTDRSLRVFTPMTTPDLPVKFACRMSSGFPFLFPAVYWQREWGLYMGKDISGHKMIDGGTIMNLPTPLLASSADFQMCYFGEKIEASSIVSFSFDQDEKVHAES